MSVENLIGMWKDTRSGLIQEVERIPADQFSFKATPETRSVAELLQHIVQAQKFLVGETCRAGTNLRRQPFADHTREYAPGVDSISDKNGLMELLRSSMDLAEATIRSYGDKLDGSMTRLDGKPTSKVDFLTFTVSHEMYHRGQLTVYQRLLHIEPALTERFRQLSAKRD
jgi:uncharacterized damage-inducible protein DinB